MPFVTEELAHQMDFIQDGESIMYAHFPTPFDELGIDDLMDDVDDILDYVEDKFQLIRAGRNLRVSYDIAPGKKLKYHIKAATANHEKFLKDEWKISNSC